MEPHERGVVFVLCAILLLNIIALVVLNHRLVVQEATPTAPSDANTQPSPAIDAPAPGPALPVVRALVLEDRDACPDCFDVRLYAAELNRTFPLTLEDGDLALWRSRLAADDRMLANADRLPAIAFNATLEEYPGFLGGWEQVGYTITFGTGPYAGTWWVLPTLNPPWIERGVVRGRVSATYLVLPSCDACANESVFRDALARSRVTLVQERVVDADSPQGKSLITSYGIQALPSLILDREAAWYYGFNESWRAVGTIESDGTYVLRNPQPLNITYYDRALGRVMTP